MIIVGNVEIIQSNLINPNFNGADSNCMDKAILMSIHNMDFCMKNYQTDL